MRLNLLLLVVIATAFPGASPADVRARNTATYPSDVVMEAPFGDDGAHKHNAALPNDIRDIRQTALYKARMRTLSTANPKTRIAYLLLTPTEQYDIDREIGDSRYPLTLVLEHITLLHDKRVFGHLSSHAAELAEREAAVGRLLSEVRGK